MGLRKSELHRSKMIGIRNKKVGRDLTFESVKNIANKYRSRSEFQKMDSSAYVTARIGGYLDKVCEHMVSMSFSIPQLMLCRLVKSLISTGVSYNDRKVISPYEIDIFVSEYNIGFEYNGKGWHLNNKNDNLKNLISNNLGIRVFIFFENSRSYESDIKSQFKNYLNEINKLCKLKISEKMIDDVDLSNIYDDIIDSRKIKDICDGYTKYSDFRKKESTIYHYLIKSNSLSKYTSHMERSIKSVDENQVIHEISKYKYLGDLIENCRKCYTWVKKNKKEYLLEGLILKQNKKLKYQQS